MNIILIKIKGIYSQFIQNQKDCFSSKFQKIDLNTNEMRNINWKIKDLILLFYEFNQCEGSDQKRKIRHGRFKVFNDPNEVLNNLKNHNFGLVKWHNFETYNNLILNWLRAFFDHLVMETKKYQKNNFYSFHMTIHTSVIQILSYFYHINEVT